MSEYVARAEMLIHRPVAEVFDAFVDPRKITKFWLASTTGPLASGARVRWEFMVPGAFDDVVVTAFEAQKRIAFDWPDSLSVDMSFDPWDDDATHLTVTTSGFEGEDIVKQVVNTTEGFAIVLCDLKTLLETGRSSNLVRDRAALLARS
jgi:uncharacterized protein YndB with AHSA1/START domain